jgi:hypothetical protein
VVAEDYSVKRGGARLFEVTERLIRKADAVEAAIREHMAKAAKRG